MREELFHIIFGILIPFLGTTIGAGSVFFVKNEIKPVIQKLLLGFASGIMVAASVWSLLIPAMEMCEPAGKLAFVPAAGPVPPPIMVVTPDTSASSACCGQIQ